MEYNWLTSHDPITIDANLAEIDFDDFKNEDIQNAYAFSLQSYVSISMDNLLKTSLSSYLWGCSLPFWQRMLAWDFFSDKTHGKIN